MEGVIGEQNANLTVDHYLRSPEQDQRLMMGGELSGGFDTEPHENVRVL